MVLLERTLVNGVAMTSYCHRLPARLEGGRPVVGFAVEYPPETTEQALLGFGMNAQIRFPVDVVLGAP